MNSILFIFFNFIILYRIDAGNTLFRSANINLLEHSESLPPTIVKTSKNYKNYMDILHPSIVSNIVQRLPLQDQWDRFHGNPVTYPCPSNFVWNEETFYHRLKKHNDDIDDDIDASFNPFKIKFKKEYAKCNQSVIKKEEEFINQSSEEIMNDLLCTSDVSIVDFSSSCKVMYKIWIKIFELLKYKGSKNQLNEMKIKSFSYYGNEFIFRQLFHYLEINLSYLDHLNIIFYELSQDNFNILPSLPIVGNDIHFKTIGFSSYPIISKEIFQWVMLLSIHASNVTLEIDTKHMKKNVEKLKRYQLMISFSFTGYEHDFRQLLFILEIDISMLQYLKVDIFESNPEEIFDPMFPLPDLKKKKRNDLRSLHINNLLGSNELDRWMRELIDVSNMLDEIVFNREFEDFRYDSQGWEETVEKLSHLSSITYLNYYEPSSTFLIKLLKNQSSTLKKFIFNDPMYLINNDSNFLELYEIVFEWFQELKKFQQLEKIEFKVENDFSSFQAIIFLLLQNNRHLKHISIDITDTINDLSNENISQWKEVMGNLIGLESLTIYIIDDNFGFFIHILKGLRNSSSLLKELTLFWWYDKSQDTKELLKIIHEMKSLRNINLPNSLGINK